MEARGARIWIFVGFVLGFAAIIAAVWSMIASFSSDSSYKFRIFYQLLLSNLLQYGVNISVIHMMQNFTKRTFILAGIWIKPKYPSNLWIYRYKWSHLCMLIWGCRCCTIYFIINYLFFSHSTEDSWPAISVLIQNIFIFLGSIVFKFGRTEETY